MGGFENWQRANLRWSLEPLVKWGVIQGAFSGALYFALSFVSATGGSVIHVFEGASFGIAMGFSTTSERRQA